MKIARLESFPLQYTEPNDFNNIRYTLLVKITTDEGIAGWGEAVLMWPEAVVAAKTIIEKGFAPLLEGADPADIEAHWRNMKRHTWWYGEGGIVSFAISGVDMALWDIKGKALGQPLYRLLGGLAHDRLPACASTHPSKPTVRENAEELAAYVSQGFQSVKTGFGKKGHAGLGRNNDHDLSFVRTVREMIGPQTGFMVDIGNAVQWDVAGAVKMTRAFEEFGIDWIEEPLHPDNREGYAELRRKTSARIAAGERENTVHDYYRLIQAGFVDVIGIDPARAEGITGFWKVAQLAGQAGKKINAHCWSTAITTAASLHLSLASPYSLLLELHALPSPMQSDLVTEPIVHRNGWVEPLHGPGLGIEVREDVLRKYRLQEPAGR